MLIISKIPYPKLTTMKSIRTDPETSLLRRLQAQTHSDEAPPIGKIHPFNEMAVNFEPLIKF